MTDPNLSLLCMEKLEQAGFTPREKAFNKYCRFFRRTRPLTDMNDSEVVRGLANAMLQEAEPWFSRAEKVFREVFRQYPESGAYAPTSEPSIPKPSDEQQRGGNDHYESV